METSECPRDNAAWSLLSSVVRAGLSTAPFAGGIASVWSDWDSSRRFARIDRAVRELALALDRMGSRFDPTRLGEAEMQLLEQILERISREHREWKRAHFVNLLASDWVHVETPFEEREHFGRALESFDHIHLRIMSHLDERARQDLDPIDVNDLYRSIAADAAGEEFKFGIFMPAMNMLAGDFGFVRRRAPKDTGVLMRGVNPDGLTFHCLCLLLPQGQRFMRFLNLSDK
jgi:hypothetical protein